MMRRKQYLYSAALVPRKTQYRRRLREMRLRSVATAENVTPESGTVHDHALSSANEPPACQVQHQQFETTLQDVDNESERNPSIEIENSEAATSILQRTDSGVAGLSSHETDNETMETVTIPYATDDCESVSSNCEEDINFDVESLCSSEESEVSAEFNSEEDLEEDNCVDPLLSTPLNALTKATVGDALLMCLALGLRHSLSWTAILDILTMINHLFETEIIQATKHFFLKYMEAGNAKTTYHIYCPNCERLLGTRESMSENQFAACVCGVQLKDINEASTYFLSFSLEEQIKELLKDKNFVSGLSYRFERKKTNVDAYEDLFDGELYRSLSGRGKVLADRFNMSYTFNTDGFPVGGKSGKQTCWPIFVQINELPPRMRSKYMILAGLYVGKKDPNMKIFLYPFVQEANNLSSVGINWGYNGKEINSKIVPLCACVDSPARAKLLNMSQFNGYYGCTLCHCKAEHTEFGLRYTIPLNGLKERTHQEILSDAAQAHANILAVQNKKKRSVKGVKGFSPIHIMEYLDLVRGVRPDTMHSKLLGNGHHHTSIFVDAVGRPFYIGSEVRQHAINSRLLCIKPPSSVMRPPRNFQQVTSWKATEWRSWVLFYGTVCLQGLIPDKYVVHFSLLCTSLHIILQKSVSKEDLQRAHTLILRYVYLYQEFFGKRAMVFNVHLLLHTKRDIECLGPAWTNTAFGFEGANKCLLQLKKSTSSIAKEIARKYLTFKSLPILCEKYATSGETLKFCERLSGRPLKSFLRVGRVTLFGSGRSCILDVEENDALNSSEFTSHGELLSYDKMVYNSIRYSTNSYCKTHKHDDSFVCLNNGVRGFIHKICSNTINGSEVAFIFLRELILSTGPLFEDEHGRQSPIKRVESEGQLFVTKTEDISAQCVAMFLDNGNFICDMPYGCYSDS